MILHGVSLPCVSHKLNLIKSRPCDRNNQVNPARRGADSEHLDEGVIPKADLTRPIIIVRMRPEISRLIDGNYQVAKARRLGVKELPAYYLTEVQHRQFFTFEIADRMYVDFWNDKLELLEKDGRQWGVVGSFQV